jgi:hypothetical protein
VRRGRMRPVIANPLLSVTPGSPATAFVDRLVPSSPAPGRKGSRVAAATPAAGAFTRIAASCPT